MSHSTVIRGHVYYSLLHILYYSHMLLLNVFIFFLYCLILSYESTVKLLNEGCNFSLYHQITTLTNGLFEGMQFLL